MQQLKTSHLCYNELMIFFTSFQFSTYVYELNHILKLLFIGCILHLLKYIETHATYCFVIILE
jgi:hypothetical protein